MGDLVPLADFQAARDAIAEHLRHTCRSCPFRKGCEDAGEGLWCDDDPEPDVPLRLTTPPDIVA